MTKSAGLGIERYRGNRNRSRYLRKILGNISQNRMSQECHFDKSLLEKIESQDSNLRVRKETIQTVVDAFNELIRSKKYWELEPFLVTFEELSTLVEVEDLPSRNLELKPISDEVLALSITTIPGVGSNFKPNPDHNYSGDPPATYRFMGKFHLRALQDCEVYQIQMHVVREGRYALAGCLGRLDYSHGADIEGRFGSLKINGEYCYLDGNYHLHKIVKFTKGSLSSLSISVCCKPAIYKDEMDTASLWYWIDAPEQILEVSYIRNGINFLESHHFHFSEDLLTFQKATIRRLSANS